MAKLIPIHHIHDSRGALGILDQHDLPFPVQRVFYIYGVPSHEQRGGHRHHRTRMLLIALAGACAINVTRFGKTCCYDLNLPTQGLLLEPEDWHTMSHFTEGAVLIVLASEKYDPADYILEPN